ncbi:MAG TPA: uroporphyrinogen decarboxylase family protein [Planctomycetota bacterium]|nr:uroporphyrinogen decarboxylase family protein [Planctomycetota bacterium]
MKDSIIDGSKPRLTHRERFQRLMHYQSVDRGVHWEFGFLGETIDRWHNEGLAREITAGEGPGSIEAYFGVDPCSGVPVNYGLIPEFTGETKVLEKTADKQTLQYPDGTIAEVQTHGTSTIPHYIKMPIANRDDWKRFKERLNPGDPARKYDWKSIGQHLLRCELPVCINLGSYFGVPRNWIGFENLAMMCYDDRELVEEIVETLTNLHISQLEPALKECRVDYAGGWEDICFRGGPMISPQMFREIVGPRLKRVCDLLRRHGCDVIITDCDGDVRPLIPVWLESGLNCMFPLEVHPGSDPVAIRKEWGRQILLRGGIDKQRLSKGKKEILAELKRVECVVNDGAYIPGVDHRVPEDVPYENYKYYIREKLALLGWRNDEVAQVWPIRNMKSTFHG